MQTPDTTLIISIYNNLAALELILLSLKKQYRPGLLEVIIAEDQQSELIRDYVKAEATHFPFPLVHLQQEDIGFRKCKMLNQAIRHARGTYLIFIDGDCVLHPKFIYQHVLNKRIGQAIYGRRVMLSHKLTQALYQSKKLSLLNIFQFVVTKCQRLDAALYLPFLPPKNKIGIWGHNWSIHKSDIQKVAGFDESYTSAGIGEDTDIEWRLVQTGITFLRCKNKLVQYHLWHPEHYQSTEAVQEKLANKKASFEQTQQANLLLGDL